MPSSGGSAAQLTDHDGFDAMPVWSPDGEWIAFSSDRGATPDQRAAIRTGSGNAGLAIFAMRSDGTDPRLLYRWEVPTIDPTLTHPAPPEGEAAFPLSWAD